MITHEGKPLDQMNVVELSRFRGYVCKSRARMLFMEDGADGVKDADLTLKEIDKQLRIKSHV